MQPLRVLSCDGGGVRGMFSFHVLAQALDVGNIDQVTAKFDLCVGTSVGALVAAFISFGFMNSDKRKDALDLINRNLADMFRAANEDGPLLAPMYDGVGKRAVLERIFGMRKMSESLVPLVVTTVTLQTGRPVLFRSWDPKTKNVLIVDVLDASSAAPALFPPVRILADMLIDGGVLMNNPLEVALLAALQLFGGDMAKKSIRILSIGTTNSKKFEFGIEKMHDLGFIALFANGFLDIMLGINNNIPILLAQTVLGEHAVLRVSSDITGDLDDISETFRQRLQDSANRTWTTQGTQILEFFGS
jgi:patatin-like phospholipase/acyl hydrolase